MRKDRSGLIVGLMKTKVPIPVVQAVARLVRSPVKPKGREFDIYDSLSDQALEIIHECFFKKEVDRAGRYLEYRLGAYLWKKEKPSNIEFRKKITGKSSAIYEVDVICFDDKGSVTTLGECKARGGQASKEDVTKFLQLVNDFLDTGRGYSLQSAYFISLAGLAEDARRILISKVGDSGRIRKFGLSRPLFQTTRGIQVSVLEERQGKIMQVFP